MKFSAKGTLRKDPDKRQVEVVWEDGRLSGDQAAVAAVAHAAQEQDGHDVGPVGGPFTTTDHLQDPLSASFLISDWVFDVQGFELEGDVPEVPDVPDGCIA